MESMPVRAPLFKASICSTETLTSAFHTLCKSKALSPHSIQVKTNFNHWSLRICDINGAYTKYIWLSVSFSISNGKALVFRLGVFFAIVSIKFPASLSFGQPFRSNTRRSSNIRWTVFKISFLVCTCCYIHSIEIVKLCAMSAWPCSSPYPVTPELHTLRTFYINTRKLHIIARRTTPQWRP